jgi:hypothetical protein
MTGFAFMGVLLIPQGRPYAQIAGVGAGILPAGLVEVTGNAFLPQVAYGPIAQRWHVGHALVIGMVRQQPRRRVIPPAGRVRLQQPFHLRDDRVGVATIIRAEYPHLFGLHLVQSSFWLLAQFVEKPPANACLLKSDRFAHGQA